MGIRRHARYDRHMKPTSFVEIRALTDADRPAWEALYRAYAEFYGVDQDADDRAKVWGWLQALSHPVRGLAASDGGKLVGIAHFRRFPRPLAAAEGLFLDDLFVAPEARGYGVARALVERLAELARQEHCSLVRWITADDNYRARGLYDALAVRTMWVTYDLLP